MATSIRPVSIARDVAELMKANRRVGGAIAASQVPVPAKDRLVIATNGSPATWQLSALPYVGDLGSSLNLSLNGQELDESTDYTADYTTGLVTFSAGQQALFKATPTPADVLTADYTTSDDLIAQAQPADLGDITDTFNRANSASTVNPASDGGTWTDDASAFGISGNAAYSFGAGSGTFWDFSGKVIHRDLHSAIQVVQADVLRAVSGNNSRLYLNLSTGSPGSAYALVWNVGNDFKLYKSFSNGTATTLIAGPVSVANLLGSYHTIKGTSDGAGTLRFYVDGSHIAGLDYTDGSPLTGTRVGLGLYTGDTGTNFLFDNFSASQS